VLTCGENLVNSDQVMFSLKATLHPGKPDTVRALLDTCARTSFITKATADKYNIPISLSQVCHVRGIGAREVIMPMSKCNFRLFSVLNGQYVDVKDAYVIDKICDDLPPLFITSDQFPPLPFKTLTEKFPRTEREPVDVLLSAAVMSQLLGTGTKIVKCGPNNGITLIETALGQVLGGNFQNNVTQALTTSCDDFVDDPTNLQLIRQLQDFWNWETIGIRPRPERVLSQEDRFAIEHFNKNLKFIDNHYQVSLPFLPNLKRPTNNYQNVLQMFLNLEKTLLKNKTKYDAYIPAFEAFIEKGFFELVPKEQEKKYQNVFYLPHFAVFREGHDTTAVRVVKNAAATDRSGVSLNASLAQGPLLLHDLFDQLMLFRQFRVPICADVEKLFLMVGVDVKDRDYLRLLWRNPGSESPIQTYRMKVLPFGLNCSPYLAQAVVMQHIEKFVEQFPKAVNLLKKGLYCDDLLSGADSEDEAIELREQIQFIMNKASMNMRKWLSNSKKVMQSIPSENQAKTAQVIIKEQDFDNNVDMPKTLGICWDPSTDSFNFINVNALTYVLKSETMRSLASRAARLYDPLGLLAPVIISAKILMQECYKAELEWDAPLPEIILVPWEQWKQDLPLLSAVSFPRYVELPNAVTREIHVFSDASERACAAVAYLRVSTSDQRVKITLLAAKTKLAPLKLKTIPRLELLAAELGAKLAHKINQSYNVDRIICWVDSLSVLQWINKPSSHWKTYVGNRVASIAEHVDPACFRYCSTHENIADIASRGLKASEFIKYKTWINGPLFLDEDEDCWPLLPEKSNVDLAKVKAIVNEELKPLEPLALATSLSQENEWEKIFSVTRNFMSGMRIFCWINRFIKRLKREQVPETSYITNSELKLAMQKWLSFVQSIHFEQYAAKVKRGESLAGSPLAQLTPKLNECQHLIVGGRIQEAIHLSHETRFPVILPKHDKYVEQFVLYLHKIHSHASPETCLFILRQKYWLLGGRREIKRILRVCECYKLRARPFQTQMSPLPLERLTPIEAFVNIGFDTFGHFETAMTISGLTETFKTYAIIFTCLVTRAVHVELVYNLSTLEFLNAFERFISTRGQVKYAVCDNQTAFRKASKQMQRLYKTLDWDRVAKWCTSRYEPIDIKFNVPLSPWQGGVFERMIGSIKKALKATIGTKTLELPQLITLLKSAESIVNQRPLTYISNDPNDPLPLSPDLILIGRPLGSLPDSLANDKTASRIDILWKKRQKLQSEFGVRFQKEYITSLLPTSKWTRPGRAPTLNEVVLVHKETRNRMFWPLGVVKKIHHGRDGIVRSCDIQLKNGDIIKRPISLLLKLEANTVDDTAQAAADAQESSAHADDDVDGEAQASTAQAS
jgi:hypothetical protein